MLFKMANEKKLKQINKNAILVHQLLPENKNSALSYFPTDSIEKVSCDFDGLQIFFKEYDLVVKSILRRKIEVEGSFYKIYPKVTNLTVTGIGPYATCSEIEDIMQYYGFIIDSYRIEETKQENGYKTVSLTNDYRAILDVPEVFAPKLRPVELPGIRNKTFKVSFFCRFCRNNGHMQFQCPKILKSSPSPFRCYSRTSYENDSSDLVIKKDRISCPQSDFCVNKRNSKTYSNYHVKIEKEQNYFPNQNCYSKDSSNSSFSTCQKSMDVSRRMSCEKNSGDSIIRKNACKNRPSDFCVNKRNSKTRHDSRVKNENEQNYFSDQSCDSKNSCNSSSSSHRYSMCVSRRISGEKDSGVISKNSSNTNQSDLCVNKRNSKIRPDSHVQHEKEQNCFPDQSCYSKNSCNSSSSSHPHSMCVSRRISGEKDSGDLVIRKNSSNTRQSDFCVNKRNSKIRPDSHVKNEKEQNYFPDQNCYSKNSCNSSSSSYHQSTDVSRQISREKDFGDLVIRKNACDSRRSDFCVNKRNSKTWPDSHVKKEKEQNYVPDQSCYSKNSCNSSSSSYHQSMDVSRQISCEKDFEDVVIRKNASVHRQSDFCVNKRNFKTPPDSHVKNEKEQNYFPDQSCYSKNSYSSSSSSYHQSMDFSRRIPCEKDSKDLVNRKNESNSNQSDFCVNKRNSKTRSDSHIQNEKKQNYFPDQNCYSKNSSHSSSTTYQQSMDVSRRISCEDDYGDLINDNKEIDSPASDFCVDQKNSKNSPDSHVKTEKKQNYFPDQNCCYRNMSHKNDNLKSSYVKSTHSKPKNFHNRQPIADYVKIPRKRRKDKVSSMPTDANEKSKDNYSPAFKARETEKMNIDQHCENEETFERIQASTSNECSNKRSFAINKKRKKKTFMHLLSSLLPPNIDVLETKKLINIAIKCEPKDIPAEVKDVLLAILKYNSGVKRKIGNKTTRTFLNWVEAALSKIMKQEQFQSENSFKDPVKHPTKEKGRVKDGKSATGIPKEQPAGRRKVTLSLGIREAISKTPGELEPTFLCNFLNQVRGRKKLLEVASVFTKNIPALASQLLEVQNTYYKYVEKRGPEEDRDISYIKRLRLRLQKPSGNATDVVIEREVSNAEIPPEIESDITEVSGKTESDMTEVSEKTESDMTEMSVKTESDMSETFVKTELDMTQTFVKTESDIADIFVKTESDMTNTFVETESDMTKISVKESGMREISVEAESDMREISVKRETEIFMRQSSSSEEFLGQDLSPYCLHGASYFTNITQMPFSLTSIKSEVNYID